MLRSQKDADVALPPPARAAAELVARMLDVDATALAPSRERVLAYSDLAFAVR